MANDPDFKEVNDDVVIRVPRKIAEAIDFALADVFCWHSGFKAGRVGTDLQYENGPENLQKLRDFRDTLHRAMEPKPSDATAFVTGSEKASELPKTLAEAADRYPVGTLGFHLHGGPRSARQWIAENAPSPASRHASPLPLFFDMPLFPRLKTWDEIVNGPGVFVAMIEDDVGVAIIPETAPGGTTRKAAKRFAKRESFGGRAVARLVFEWGSEDLFNRFKEGQR